MAWGWNSPRNWADLSVRAWMPPQSRRPGEDPLDECPHQGARHTAHAAKIQRAGLGAEAEYLKDERGQVVLDKEGQPHLLRPAVVPCWQASARYLEAVDHERWGRKIRADLTIPEGGPTELIVTVVKRRELPEDIKLPE